MWKERLPSCNFFLPFFSFILVFSLLQLQPWSTYFRRHFQLETSWRAYSTSGNAEGKEPGRWTCAYNRQKSSNLKWRSRCKSEIRHGTGASLSWMNSCAFDSSESILTDWGLANFSTGLWKFCKWVSKGFGGRAWAWAWAWANAGIVLFNSLEQMQELCFLILSRRGVGGVVVKRMEMGWDRDHWSPVRDLLGDQCLLSTDVERSQRIEAIFLQAFTVSAGTEEVLRRKLLILHITDGWAQQDCELRSFWPCSDSLSCTWCCLQLRDTRERLYSAPSLLLDSRL